MARDPYSKNRPKYWRELLGEGTVAELVAEAHRNAERIKGRKVMFKSKGGKVFHNPAIGRQHDRDAAAGKGNSKPMPDEQSGDDGADHGPVHRAVIHHPDDAENPSPGKHHTVMHHADGHEEHMDHDSSEEAHAHSQEQMSDGGDDMGDQDDDAGDDYGDIGGQDDGDSEY